MNSSRIKKSKTAGHLLLLGCSATKRIAERRRTAIELYDGVNFRVLRKYLSENGWPAGLEVKILSAKYGLIDAADLIEWYDERMTPARAEEYRPHIEVALKSLGRFQSVFVNLGKGYLPALTDVAFERLSQSVTHAEGGIGQKMKSMKEWLRQLPNRTASLPRTKGKRPYLYFFPDWDDYVTEPFSSEFGSQAAGKTSRRYAHEIFGPKQTPYDGLLVSLAQLYTGKGALWRLDQHDTTVNSWATAHAWILPFWKRRFLNDWPKGVWIALPMASGQCW